MSAEAWCLVAILAMLALGLIGAFEFERKLREHTDDELDQRNTYTRVVYHEAGMKWYPHKMRDGTIRWYDVAMDVRGAGARR